MVAVSNSMLKKGILMTLSYAFVMSISAASAKQAQTVISVPVLLFWQSFICCLFALPQIWGRWRMFPFSVWKVLLLRSFCGFMALLCYYYALDYIPILDASILRTCAPLCVPFVVFALYRKAVPKARWLPLFVGFVGAALVIHPTPTNISVWHFVGFASAIGLAVSMVTTRMLSTHISHREALFCYFGLSAVFSLIIAVFTEESIYLPRASWHWVSLVCLTLYLGMYLYTLAYTYAPASVVSPVSYSGVVFAGIWGWLFWQQVPDIYAWVGAFLVFLNIILSARARV